MPTTDPTLDPQGFKAAFRAAFPGLPSCMNIDEARRRLEAGIRAYEAAKTETAPDPEADAFMAALAEAENPFVAAWERLTGPDLELETRQSHVTYPSPEEGGEEGYMARCWDCNWTGPLRPRGRDGKNQARKDREAHPVIAESRLVSAWKPAGGATTTDGETC
jgi:hypothetical protein